MLKLQEHLRAFAALFEVHEVRYLIVGGYAVAYHGYPRFTGDIDFFVEVSPENAHRVHLALCDFGFGNVGLSEADFLEYGAIVQLGHPPNRIDVLTRIDGVNFEEAWPRRQRATLDGIELWFVDYASLISNKRAAGRPKDRVDVARLEHSRRTRSPKD